MTRIAAQVATYALLALILLAAAVAMNADFSAANAEAADAPVEVVAN